MAFTPKTAPFSGKINAVTLGTGDKAIVIGGQNVMPFYTFDAPIENAPKIGVEISDLAANWDAPALNEFYAGCTTMVDYAKRAETMPGADFLCLHFESADPNGENRSVAECVADAKAVADAVTMPHVEKELSAMEMSIICSNLARGCEKQYLPQQAEDFRKLAAFFRSKAEPVQEASTAKLLELIEKCRNFLL